MLQIVLIRPGATDYDQERRIQGRLDVPLNEQGAIEVARVIDEIRDLKIETVYASACEPSLQTAQTIAGALGAKSKKMDRMQNVDQGLWQGVLIDEVRVKQPKVYRQWQEHPETVCPPDGEMLSQAEDRVRAAVARLVKRHKEGIIALVVPEPLASIVRHQVSQAELGDLWKAADEHGHWEILEVKSKPLVASS